MTEIGQKILAASLQHADSGGLIVSGHDGVYPAEEWPDEEPDEDEIPTRQWQFSNIACECCPLGVIVLENEVESDSLQDDSARLLGTTDDYTFGFIIGFDENAMGHGRWWGEQEQGFEDGKEVRLALLEKGVPIRHAGE